MKSNRIPSVVLCFASLFSAISLRAQTYTPVPYNFSPVFEVTDGSGHDSATDLSMDCLTANGYGQWTASYKTRNHFDSGSPGLFLLANSLRAPAANSATGIVSFRPFILDTNGYPVDSAATNRSVVKCASNLKGRVRWVWPSRDHQSFIVEGFDECPANGDSGRTGINLEFASYPYNTTYGTADSLRRLAKDVIKKPFPTVNYATGLIVAHPVVTADFEPDPRDWFSITMDTTYLYIVWEEYDSFGHYNIWELTQRLSDGFFTSALVEVAAGGRRPTVNAEIRRAPGFDSLYQGCFDVAYSTDTTNSGHLIWYNYDGARTPKADTMSMNKSYKDTTGSTFSYKRILHTCMLDASWESIASSDTTPRAIYAVVADMAGNTHLIMHKIKGGAQDATAYYCDGPKIKYHAAGVDDGNFQVVDKSIRAFVNPYDGEQNSNFDEYHCMYQLLRTYSGGGSHKPLMIIHSAKVGNTLGPRSCLNFAGIVTPLTHRPLFFRPDSTYHAFFVDPGVNTDGGYEDNYVGAVNQMGIQCHWRSDSEHYYIRDQRKFDEDIEENTFATEDCFIADGTSHGGTIGAVVQPGKTMTLFTGIHIDYNLTYPGLCILHFPSSGANWSSTELSIGTGSGSPAKLVSVWDYWTDCHDSTQYIHIKANSFFECESYNGPTSNNGGLWLDGSGASMTGGSNGWPSSISNPATLNIHGDADLDMFPGSLFKSTNGIVNVLNDQNYRVDTGNVTSGNALEIMGNCLIDSSMFIHSDTGYASASNEYGDLFEIEVSTDTTLDTIKIINSYFHNGLVQAGITGFDAGKSMLPMVISGGKFVNASLRLVNPLHGVSIQDVIFDLVGNHSPTYQYALGLDKTDTLPYDFITIQDCNFKQMADGCDGIKITGYAINSGVMEHIHVLSDTFNYSGGSIPHAAIELQNSEAFIQGNQITGAFSYGIIVTGAGSTLSPHTKSLICTNKIGVDAGLAAGIATDNTQGYCKMNNVTVNGTGHICGVNDQAHIIFSLYDGNGGNGLSITDASAGPDLTGVHSISPHVEDYAAFDTIESNASEGVAQIALVQNANVHLGNDIQLWDWSDWSRDNIIGLDGFGSCGGSIIYHVPLIIADGGHTHTTLLGNISHNFFGDSTILPEHDSISGCGSPDTFGTPSSWQFPTLSYPLADGFCYSADSNCKTWQNRIPGTIECEESLPLKSQKGATPQSIQIDTSSCQYKGALGYSLDNSGDYQQAYSALQWYMETCYDTGQAWHALVNLDDAVQRMNSDPSRYENFREWLKSVLWLNRTDPYWYCMCVRSIIFSYRWDSTAKGLDYNAAMAIQYYIQNSGHCPFDSTFYMTGDTADRLMQRQLWLDTVNQLHGGDTIHFPEDTTLPTIDDLGLQILRGPPADVKSIVPSQTGIGSLTASENPFKKETTVSFSMGEYAYVSFQVFDLLGTVVQGDYKGKVLSPGEHSFTVDGANLPPGTYYARITTPIGETRMIKLVRE